MVIISYNSIYFIGLYNFRDAKSIINFLSKVAIAYSIVVLLFE